MGLFTPDDRERAAEMAEEASARPAAVADAVVEEGLPSADDEPTRVYAARALADAAEADPENLLARAGDLRGLLDDDADVRSHAERGLAALADHCRERGEAALDRADRRLADGDPDGAGDALADARQRFARVESLYEDAPGDDPTLADTIGVRTVGDAGEDLFTPLLGAGTDLPASTDWTFTTGRDAQQALEMTVLRASGEVSHERPLSADDEALASLHLQGLPPAPAGVPVLAVRVEVDEDGAVTAALVDRGTGKRVEQRAGTAALSRGGSDRPDLSPPDGVEERLAALEERVAAADAADARGTDDTAGGTDGNDDGEAGDDEEVGDEGPTPEQATPLGPPESDEPSTPLDGEASPGTPDADDSPPADGGGEENDADAAVAGPGKQSAARGHAERTSEATDPDAADPDAADPDGPGEREIERALDARDDLKRAIEAETDDPDVVRDGVEMTVRRLDGDEDDGPATAVRETLASVVDATDEDVAALRERASDAVERVDEVLADAHVEVVDPDPGEPADADRHRVVEKTPSDQPEGHVVAVEQTGYARDGTVRRPARVRVSDGTASTDADPGETADGTAEPMPGGPSETSAEPMPGDVAEPASGGGDARTSGSDDPGAGGPDDAGASGPSDAAESDGRVPDHAPGGPSLALDHADLTGREVLARGDAADVYRATVERDGTSHEVAVTEPHVEGGDDPGAVERFDAAVADWAALDDHDHVVDVVDWGTDPVAWVATEFPDGGSLADRTGEFDLEQAVWTAVRVADAVFYAHRQGVGHFDLRPASVQFRTVEGAWDVPKVADLGLAGLLLDHADGAGASARYAAPEQLDEAVGTPGRASDVYAVGAVTYELVTGRPPFTGPASRAVEKVVDGDVPPPSRVNPDVPADLEAIIQRAMARRPDDRHEHALALREDLRDLLGSLR